MSKHFNVYKLINTIKLVEVMKIKLKNLKL